VVSLAQQYPGPFATLLMSDLGADVVQVEHPRGDPTRRHAAFYESVNRNKAGVCLDLKTEEGRVKLAGLLDDCDIFLEGFKPGTADRLGVGYPALCELYPRLIYVSISAFGQTGPYRDRPAHDLSIQAISGMLWGHESGALAAPYIGHADLVAGMFAAFGAVSALQLRHVTGKGTYVDVAMADCLVSWMTAIVGPAMNGAGFNEPNQPGYGAFRCADDRWLTLSVDRGGALLATAGAHPRHARTGGGRIRGTCRALRRTHRTDRVRHPHAPAGRVGCRVRPGGGRMEPGAVAVPGRRGSALQCARHVRAAGQRER